MTNSSKMKIFQKENDISQSRLDIGWLSCHPGNLIIIYFNDMMHPKKIHHQHLQKIVQIKKRVR